MAGGRPLLDARQLRLMREMMSRVEALPVFIDRHQGGALAVDAHDVGLRREAVAHMGDVANVDHGVPDGLDGQIIEFARRSAGCRWLHVVFVGADLGGARGKDQVLRADGVHDIVRRKPLACKAGGVQIHLHLACFSPIRPGDGAPPAR